MNNVIFLDGAEQQWIVHWLGIPYLLESSFGGRFHNVLTMDEQSIDLSLERKILDKFFLMKRSGIEPNGWGYKECRDWNDNQSEYAPIN